jgi:hypothetical protein
MKSILTIFGDRKTFRDALLHYLVADVLFSAFLGGSVSFVILFFMRQQALFLFQGVWGMVIESTVTWLSVMLSVRLLNRTRTDDVIGMTFIATGFGIIASLVALPYIHFFSVISRSSTTYLFLKEALHIAIFYSATMIYFSGSSLKSLLKNARNR